MVVRRWRRKVGVGGLPSKEGAPRAVNLKGEGGERRREGEEGEEKRGGEEKGEHRVAVGSLDGGKVEEEGGRWGLRSKEGSPRAVGRGDEGRGGGRKRGKEEGEGEGIGEGRGEGDEGEGNGEEGRGRSRGGPVVGWW
jgi:hypothetical protein